MVHLKPSEIFYSQDTISGKFRSSKNIGDTLDDLYDGRIKIRDIPTISVVKKDDKWVTLDNRRLWVFHHLQGAGKCDTIPVIVVRSYSDSKFTSNNGGTSIYIRHGHGPGGKCHRFIIPVKPELPKKIISETIKSEIMKVRETKLSTTLSSTITDKGALHPHFSAKSCVDNPCVQLEFINNALKSHSSIKTSKPFKCIKENTDITQLTYCYPGQVNSSQISNNQASVMAKGVFMLKNKLKHQKELKRQTPKFLHETYINTKTWRPHSSLMRKPKLHHFTMNEYYKHRHLYYGYSKARTYFRGKFRLANILGYWSDDEMSSSDDDIDNYGETTDEESEIVNDEQLTYPSETDSEIDGVCSDADNKEIDYEDESIYFYKDEDKDITADIFQNVNVVSDTSEYTDDDDDIDDYDNADDDVDYDDENGDDSDRSYYTEFASDNTDQFESEEESGLDDDIYANSGFSFEENDFLSEYGANSLKYHCFTGLHRFFNVCHYILIAGLTTDVYVQKQNDLL